MAGKKEKTKKKSNKEKHAAYWNGQRRSKHKIRNVFRSNGYEAAKAHATKVGLLSFFNSHVVKLAEDGYVWRATP